MRAKYIYKVEVKGKRKELALNGHGLEDVYLIGQVWNKVKWVSAVSK